MTREEAIEWMIVERSCVVERQRIMKIDNSKELIEAYGMAIEALTADWIPCSERLPENGHYYLWCSDMGQVQSDYYWNGFENGMKYGYNIVAWMPLPKPYRNEMVGGRSDGRGRSTRETSTACHKTVGRHAKCKHKGGEKHDYTY